MLPIHHYIRVPYLTIMLPTKSFSTGTYLLCLHSQAISSDYLPRRYSKASSAMCMCSSETVEYPTYCTRASPKMWISRLTCMHGFRATHLTWHTENGTLSLIRKKNINMKLNVQDYSTWCWTGKICSFRYIFWKIGDIYNANCDRTLRDRAQPKCYQWNSISIITKRLINMESDIKLSKKESWI